MINFIGREKEKSAIKKALDNKTKCILIYGPRRVGKTTLIKEALKDEKDKAIIFFQCIRGSFEYNIELFANTASNILEKRYLKNIRDIFELIEAIAEISKDKHVVIVFDEYPYMRESLEEGVVDSYLQRIIDSDFENITLILSGSFITIMQKIIREGSPLYGRIGLILSIKPFNYKDASLFYPGLSNRDKIAFYSIFGGYPFALEKIDSSKSLKENIKELILDNTSSVRTTIEGLLLKEAGRSGIPEEILTRIGNSKLSFSEIASLMSTPVQGTLDRNLKMLIDMEIIERTSPINRIYDKRKIFYEIKDNLLRFYFAYIATNISLIDRGPTEDFYNIFIEKSINTFISKRFESIAREFLESYLGLDYKYIGTYWYDDKKRKKNGEFDVAAMNIDGAYSIYEVKYLRDPMSIELYEEERNKIKEIEELKISKVGFISSSGFAFDTASYNDEFYSSSDLFR